MDRRSGLVARVVLLSASPVVAWWLVGDLSEGADAEDYLFKGPELSKTQQLRLGLLAAVLFVAAAAVLGALLRQRRVSWVELRSALPLLLAAFFCGFAWRVVTARVGGANIGGGILLMVAPIFLIGMIAWSWILARISRNSASEMLGHPDSAR